MAKYQKYAEYKSINGIGVREVPVHWKRTTFKYILEKIIDNRGRTPPTFDVGIPLLEAKQIDNKSLYASLKFEKFIDQNGYENFIRDDLKYNDILFITVGTIGKTCLVPKESNFVIAQNIIGLRVKKDIDPLFTWFWLNSSIANEAMKATNKDSILDSIKISDFVQAKVYFPNLDEQKAISNFLSHEVLNIDSLIAKQEKLIELLKEKRQAVISHAVTKGLNPDVTMKDSGVEWLGQVPEHWKCIKLKHITTTFEQGWSPQCDSRPADSNEYGVLKVGCVNGGSFRSSENKALPPELEPRLQYLIQKDDLLISRANTKELVGSAAVVDDYYPNLILCDKLYRLRLSKDVLPEMVSLYLSIGVVREQIELSATGASHSMQNIGQDTIKELYYLLPHCDEAVKILESVKKSNQHFDELTQKAEAAIKLMQERRTALISSAVTGKIDVRNWQHLNEAKTEISL